MQQPSSSTQQKLYDMGEDFDYQENSVIDDEHVKTKQIHRKIIDYRKAPHQSLSDFKKKNDAPMTRQQYLETNKIWLCPINQLNKGIKHILTSYDSFMKHLTNCKQLPLTMKQKGIKARLTCPYMASHIFFSEEELKEHINNKCEFREEGAKVNEEYKKNKQFELSTARAYTSSYKELMPGENSQKKVKLENDQQDEWYKKNEKRLEEEKRLRKEKNLSFDEQSLHLLPQQDIKSGDDNNSNTIQYMAHSLYMKYQQEVPSFDLIMAQQNFKILQYKEGRFRIKPNVLCFESIILADIYKTYGNFDFMKSLIADQYQQMLVGEFTCYGDPQRPENGSSEIQVAQLLSTMATKQIGISHSASTNEHLLLISRNTLGVGRFMHREGDFSVLCIKNMSSTQSVKDEERSAFVYTKFEIENEELNRIKRQKEFEEEMEQRKQMERKLLELKRRVGIKKHNLDEFVAREKQQMQRIDDDNQRFADILRTEEQKLQCANNDLKRIQNEEEKVKLLLSGQESKAKQDFLIRERKYKDHLNSEYNQNIKQAILQNEPLMQEVNLIMQEEKRYKELFERYERQLANDINFISTASSKIEECDLVIANVGTAMKKLRQDAANQQLIEQMGTLNLSENSCIPQECLCVICAIARRKIMNLPCRHITVCQRCHKTSGYRDVLKICLICQQKVLKYVELAIPRFKSMKNAKQTVNKTQYSDK